MLKCHATGVRQTAILSCLTLVVKDKIYTFLALVSVTLDVNSGSSWTSAVKIFLHILLQVYMVVLTWPPLVYTIIAINRLTALAFPLRHLTIWNRRTVTASIFAMATLALLIDGVPFLYFGILSAVEPPAADGDSSSGPNMMWYTHGVCILFVLLSYRLFGESR